MWDSRGVRHAAGDAPLACNWVVQLGAMDFAGDVHATGGRPGTGTSSEGWDGGAHDQPDGEESYLSRACEAF